LRRACQACARHAHRPDDRLLVVKGEGILPQRIHVDAEKIGLGPEGGLRELLVVERVVGERGCVHAIRPIGSQRKLGANSFDASEWVRISIHHAPA